jgi:hypothetical protein
VFEGEIVEAAGRGGSGFDVEAGEPGRTLDSGHRLQGDTPQTGP